MDGLVFTCRIGALPQTTFQVAQFTLQEELSQLYRLTLKVVSSRDDIPLNEQLGDSASLTITRNGVTERTINGLIAGAEQGNTDGRRTFYIFTVRPTMWLMTLNQDSRIFHRQSVPEILTILLKEHRILFTRDTLYKRHVEREYTTQKRESAYDFWCRLAAEEGIVFWFEEKQTLFCDCRLGMQADIDLTYNTHPETDETDTTAYQWSYGEYLCSNGTVQKDHNFLNPKYSLEHQKQSDDSGRNSVFESYGRFQWDEEGKPFTQLRLEQLRNYSKVGTAKTHCIRLRPGKIFTLQSHPIEAMNDCWQVISVTHHGWQPVASNDGGEGTTLTNEVAFIPGRQDWRPPYRYKPLADGDEAVQGFQTLEVGQNQTVTIKGQQAISIGKNHQLNVADNQQITVGKHITMHSERGQIIIGNAGGQIVIDPMGNIRIEGVSITMTDHITGKKSAGALFDYSARYTLLSEQSDKPLVNVPYTITTGDGQVIPGKTDALGRTVTVQSAAEENLQLHSPEATPKPKQTLYRASYDTPVEYVMEFIEE